MSGGDFFFFLVIGEGLAQDDNLLVQSWYISHLRTVCLYGGDVGEGWWRHWKNKTSLFTAQPVQINSKRRAISSSEDDSDDGSDPQVTTWTDGVNYTWRSLMMQQVLNGLTLQMNFWVRCLVILYSKMFSGSTKLVKWARKRRTSRDRGSDPPLCQPFTFEMLSNIIYYIIVFPNMNNPSILWRCRLSRSCSALSRLFVCSVRKLATSDWPHCLLSFTLSL